MLHLLSRQRREKLSEPIGPKQGNQRQKANPRNEKPLLDTEGKLKGIGGSECDTWNAALVSQAVHTIWFDDSDEDACDRAFAMTAGALVECRPKDQFEGMIAAQLFATHNAAMECYRRAVLPQQTFQGRHENLRQATKLCRTYAALVETLDRHRGKGQQKVMVEHVHVHAGGQAVVGAVQTPGGGAQLKSEDQPHAKQIAYAPEPALRSADKERERVSVAGDAEWPLPDARWTVTGGSTRK